MRREGIAYSYVFLPPIILSVLTPLITCSLAKPGCQVDQFVRPIPPNSHRLSAFIVACQTIRVNIAKKILFLHFFFSLHSISSRFLTPKKKPIGLNHEETKERRKHRYAALPPDRESFWILLVEWKETHKEMKNPGNRRLQPQLGVCS